MAKTTKRKPPGRPPKKRRNVQSELKRIYYNYGQEGALLNNIQQLLKLVKKTHPKATRDNVEDFLSKQASYTVHKRVAKSQFPRRPINVHATRVRVDGDLIELGDLAPWNSGYRYIFVLIDAFSRRLWAEPMKNKEAATTAKILKRLIEEQSFGTLQLYTDGGREFLGAPFKSVLASASIKHRICTSDDFHCPFVERSIRTLKEKLFQQMTTNHSRRWIEALPLVVATYNKTIHSATGLSPIEAAKPNNYLATLAKAVKRRQNMQSKKKKWKFKVGHLVRILMTKGGPLGRKGYLPRFTWEIFRIKKLANDRPGSDGPNPVPAYVLEDLKGEVIENSLFYENELSRVHPSQLEGAAPIREVLQRRDDALKVWFHGEPKSEARWIPRSNLV